MSDLKKDVENLEEVNAAVANAAPGEPTHLKNDAVVLIPLSTANSFSFIHSSTT